MTDSTVQNWIEDPADAFRARHRQQELFKVWRDRIRPVLSAFLSLAGDQPSRVTPVSQIRSFGSAGTQSIPTEMGQIPCQCECQNESAQPVAPSPSLAGLAICSTRFEGSSGTDSASVPNSSKNSCGVTGHLPALWRVVVGAAAGNDHSAWHGMDGGGEELGAVGFSAGLAIDVLPVRAA